MVYCYNNMCESASETVTIYPGVTNATQRLQYCIATSYQRTIFWMVRQCREKIATEPARKGAILKVPILNRYIFSPCIFCLRQQFSMNTTIVSRTWQRGGGNIKWFIKRCEGLESLVIQLFCLLYQFAWYIFVFQKE